MASAQPISVVVRASDGRLLIRAGHAQLRAAGGIIGTQNQMIDGKPASSTPIRLEAFEWAFPAIENAATGTHITGSTSGDVLGSFGPMQPAGSRTTAACWWNSRGPEAPRLQRLQHRRQDVSDSYSPDIRTAERQHASPRVAGRLSLTSSYFEASAFRMIAAAAGNSFFALQQNTPSATSSGVQPSGVLTFTSAP